MSHREPNRTRGPRRSATRFPSSTLTCGGDSRNTRPMKIPAWVPQTGRCRRPSSATPRRRAEAILRRRAGRLDHRRITDVAPTTGRSLYSTDTARLGHVHGRLHRLCHLLHHRLHPDPTEPAATNGLANRLKPCTESKLLLAATATRVVFHAEPAHTPDLASSLAAPGPTTLSAVTSDTTDWCRGRCRRRAGGSVPAMRRTKTACSTGRAGGRCAGW